MQKHGVFLGLLFCLLSAAFDVYVGFVTQTLNTLLVIFYCFIASSALFLAVALLHDPASFCSRVKADWDRVLVVNVAVLLNWGGLFYALRYLEPAVVGVASVACGPALTLVISWFDKSSAKVAFADALIACLVLASVGIMLSNSLAGVSGVETATIGERLLGVSSVLMRALGTVMYTVFSKRMFALQWSVHEVLAVRNIAMIVVCLLALPLTGTGFYLESGLIAPMVVLVVAGHLLPIYLIQKTIYCLSPIHVSLVLLSLPVFVLLLQYLDDRVIFSLASVASVCVIVLLLSGRALYAMRREAA